MEIKFRAKRLAFNQIVESVATTDTIDEIWMTAADGQKFCCDPKTLEIVIDGQAVKVAKIKELLEMKSKMAELIGIDDSELPDGNMVDLLIELINNMDGDDND